MSEIDFSDHLIVAVVAFSAPFVLGLASELRLRAVVLEIVAGIAIGPSVLLFPAAAGIEPTAS